MDEIMKNLMTMKTADDAVVQAILSGAKLNTQQPDAFNDQFKQVLTSNFPKFQRKTPPTQLEKAVKEIEKIPEPEKGILSKLFEGLTSKK